MRSFFRQNFFFLDGFLWARCPTNPSTRTEHGKDSHLDSRTEPRQLTNLGRPFSRRVFFFNQFCFLISIRPSGHWWPLRSVKSRVVSNHSQITVSLSNAFFDALDNGPSRSFARHRNTLPFSLYDAFPAHLGHVSLFTNRRDPSYSLFLIARFPLGWNECRCAIFEKRKNNKNIKKVISTHENKTACPRRFALFSIALSR